MNLVLRFNDSREKDNEMFNIISPGNAPLLLAMEKLKSFFVVKTF